MPFSSASLEACAAPARGAARIGGIAPCATPLWPVTGRGRIGRAARAPPSSIATHAAPAAEVQDSTPIVEKEVLVVGGGLSGYAAALALARRGHSNVTLLDKGGDDVGEEAEGALLVSICPRGQAQLQELGLLEQAREAAVPAAEVALVRVAADGTSQPVDPTPAFADALWLPRHALGQLLRSAVEQKHSAVVNVLHGTTVTEVGVLLKGAASAAAGASAAPKAAAASAVNGAAASASPATAVSNGKAAPAAAAADANGKARTVAALGAAPAAAAGPPAVRGAPVLPPRVLHMRAPAASALRAPARGGGGVALPRGPAAGGVQPSNGNASSNGTAAGATNGAANGAARPAVNVKAPPGRSFFWTPSSNSNGDSNGDSNGNSNGSSTGNGSAATASAAAAAPSSGAAAQGAAKGATVRVRARGPAGVRLEFEPWLVVGADGARSAVRGALERYSGDSSFQPVVQPSPTAAAGQPFTLLAVQRGGAPEGAEPVPHNAASTAAGALSQSSLRGALALGAGGAEVGVALVGDALRAVQPDVGQGASAALQDAQALGRAISSAAASGAPISGLLASYDATQPKEAAALLALARLALPAQFPGLVQESPLARMLRALDTMLRVALSAIAPALFSPPVAQLLTQQPALTYSEALARVRATTARMVALACALAAAAAAWALRRAAVGA